MSMFGWRSVQRRISDALVSNDVGEFRRLLTKHPNQLRHDDGHDNWLWFGVAKGRLDIVRVLVEEFGIGVDESNSPRDRQTPLSRAARKGDLEIAEWLLNAGAKVNDDSSGVRDSPALKWAAVFGDLEMVKLLVSHGADINAGGTEHINAYMQSGTPEIKALLKSLGGVDLRDVTPPEYEASHERIIDIMVDYAEEYGHWGYLIGWSEECTGWSMECPGDPVIQIYCREAGPNRKHRLLFTVGMSDVMLTEEGDDHGYGVELMMSIPPDWPIDETTANDANWSWPMRLLEQLARRIIANGRLNVLKAEVEGERTFVIIETMTDPPQPLVPTTELCGWLLLDADGRTLPDTRFVRFLTPIAVYREEIAFARERIDYEPLVRRYARLNIPREIKLNRPNAVTDWPEGEPEPEGDACGYC